MWSRSKSRRCITAAEFTRTSRRPNFSTTRWGSARAACGVGEIGGEALGPAARNGDLRAKGLGAPAGRVVVDGQRHAAPRERAGQLPSQAAAGTGDERDPAPQLHQVLPEAAGAIGRMCPVTVADSGAASGAPRW